MNKDEQTKILKACHVDATAGHMGIKKKVSKITERFMWPGVMKDVKDLVCCLLLINVTIIIRLCRFTCRYLPVMLVKGQTAKYLQEHQS